MDNKESSPEDAGMNIYKWPAALITTYQMSPGDWDLGPMSKRNWREISKRVNDHNDSLKTVAVELRKQFEGLKAKLTPSEPVRTAEEILERVMAKESKGDSVAYYIEQGAIIEAMKEYASQFKEAVKGVHPHDPNDSWQNEGDENVYTETGHPGF